jgi:hypothetical protein
MLKIDLKLLRIADDKTAQAIEYCDLIRLLLGSKN